MPRYRARYQDAQGQTQSTFFHADDEMAARIAVQQQGVEPTEVVEVPELPPHTVGPAGDATGGLIPYKNPHALIAYYLGLFSLFPVVGFLLAAPALVLGVMGLRRRKRHPEIKGAAHAWIGIVMGAIFTLVWGAAIVMIIVGIFMA